MAFPPTSISRELVRYPFYINTRIDSGPPASVSLFLFFFDPKQRAEMDSEAQPKPSVSTKKTPSSSPVDHPPEPPAKAVAPADQIWTPEKPVRSTATRSDVARSSDVDDLLPGEEPLLFESSKAKPLIKLPEKYEMLCKFFDSMVTSIRLLPSSTFAKILTMSEILGERCFTYAHFAQSMYIMPEAIMIKKVVLHDETTCCVKSELQITLQVDAVAENINGESGSKYSILTKLFRERIVDFYNGHPQRSTRTKLFMTPEKSAKAGEEENTGRSVSSAAADDDDDDDDVLDIQPESLLPDCCTFFPIREEEQKAVEEEKEAGVANAIKRQKLIASLPNTFDMIRLIFCSKMTSAMTKQEPVNITLKSLMLLHLKLLLELVPDWTSEKIAYGGHIFCV
ncbi:unnamed protein product [Musa acuminata subsp. malaccensis]|uniref:(wild Malaysian banana) hypothetical protein n=1 Tax=Musa acuminata subsp. malaccensis TaxID=214687 RepID=A0A8D6ZJW5_MUSAM|nr:unnamed protein product [Musa acuminata subsp. malaccensis]